MDGARIGQCDEPLNERLQSIGKIKLNLHFPKDKSLIQEEDTSSTFLVTIQQSQHSHKSGDG